MLEKIKKHKFLIGIIAISLIYFILTSVQNPIFIYYADCDDYLILTGAKGILDLNWLGDFYGKLLSKGPGTAIFIAIVNIIRINFYSNSIFIIHICINFICSCIEKNNKK